jgi:hypothetical protein
MQEAEESAYKPYHRCLDFDFSQRCDAGRPACGKCTSSRKQDHCIYEFNSPAVIYSHVTKEDILSRTKPLRRHGSDSSSSNSSQTPPRILPARTSSIAIIPIPVYSGKSPPLHINSQYLKSFKPPRYTNSPLQPTIISNPPLLMEGASESAFALSRLPFHDLDMKL